MQKIIDNLLESSSTKNTNEVVMLHKMNINKKCGSTLKKN